MNTDKITSWLGVGQGVVIAIIDYWGTSHADGTFGWDNPIFYAGLGVAILVAVKAYYTNKPSAPSV